MPNHGCKDNLIACAFDNITAYVVVCGQLDNTDNALGGGIPRSRGGTGGGGGKEFPMTCIPHPCIQDFLQIGLVS
jgi:hypothetical protein